MIACSPEGALWCAHIGAQGLPASGHRDLAAPEWRPNDPPPLARAFVSAPPTVAEAAGLSPSPSPPAPLALARPAPRLGDRLRLAIRSRHCSPRTEKAYLGWVRRYVAFHGNRDPTALGSRGGALPREPRVLAPEEVQAVLRRLRGAPRMMAWLMYGAGLRLLECCRLRVKDVDFARGEMRQACAGYLPRAISGSPPTHGIQRAFPPLRVLVSMIRFSCSQITDIR
jgi:hypothetical protein